MNEILVETYRRPDIIVRKQKARLIYDNYDTTKRIENTVNSIYRITVALLVIVTLCRLLCNNNNTIFVEASKLAASLEVH
uniref:Transmembrane protein n=1 Tax=Angiostrongylus cantonensis TaxID=6313 RepID=A0A0K0CY83_ANGCA